MAKNQLKNDDSRVALFHTHEVLLREHMNDPAWRDESPPDWGLRPQDQEALSAALDILKDNFNDYRDLDDMKSSSLIENLPSRYLDCYDDAFCERYFKCFLQLADRIRSGERFNLRSVAEQLIFDAILEEANAWLEIMHSQGPSEELEDLGEEVNRDRDYEELYDLAVDGLFFDSRLSNGRFENLDFPSWFKTFKEYLPKNP